MGEVIRGKYIRRDVILYNSIVMCTEEIHQMLIQEEDVVNCIFGNKQIQDPGKPKRYFCCSNMKLVKDGYHVCKNCGQVHDRRVSRFLRKWKKEV